MRVSEQSLAYFSLFLLALFPICEIVARGIFQTGVPGSSEYIRHLVLLVTFLGGMITSREKRHLSLVAGINAFKAPWKSRIIRITAIISSSVCWTLFWSSLSMTLIGFGEEQKIGILPIQVFILVLPVGYGAMAARFNWVFSGLKNITLATVTGFAIGLLFSLAPLLNILDSIPVNLSVALHENLEYVASLTPSLAVPAIVVLAVSILVGTPIFVVLGGVAFFLFLHNGGALESIPNESYTMLINHSIPAIPLFTFAGFILSESKSGERLVGLFRSLFGWLPGGMAIMAILVCAFFTTFTGASGVTILALGGLLSFILIKGDYKEGFTHGLLTSSGHIGLMFPPSLTIILYGVVAQISIKDMFIGGLIPGLVTILIMSLYCVSIATKQKIKRVPFEMTEVISAARESVWDILLPVILLCGFFGGYITIVETGAVAVLYSLLVALFLHRDIKFNDIPGIMLSCLPIIGGVLVILASSKGLSYFIVDAEIPMNLSGWVKEHIHSKLVFLILLNVALLITGCLMDIFSAIMVVVPLILPLGVLFGVHPIHLGIIFLSNMELGYLTPPVGLNLFLASYRFDKPLGEIYLNVLPFLLILIVKVLLITYIPWITLFLFDYF
ncbi:TRAP transporter large permease subunit [bacterium]|nr:TRAP transporter large permease subunit [bacterium]